MTPDPTNPAEHAGSDRQPAESTTAMVTALVRLRGALQETAAARSTCPVPTSSGRRARRWSTSSRTTSSRG